MDNFSIEKKLYGIKTDNFWNVQNYIVAFFIKNFSLKNDDVMVWWNNPGVSYSNGLTKTQINNLNNFQCIIIPSFIYKNYFYVLKNFMGYIFLLDLSIYEFNTIENLTVLSLLEPLDNSIECFINYHNYTYHDEILQTSWSKSFLDWEYLRKNWDFLHWYIPYWMTNLLINHYDFSWNYEKSLILLLEYFPCLYSYFPEKKVLTCNYLYNMAVLSKKL